MKIIWFLRSLVFTFGQTITLLFFSLFGQLLRPFSHEIRYRFMHLWAIFCVWWVKVTCKVDYRIHGKEFIQRDKVGLILARHESAWETFALQKIFPRQAFVLKKELLKIPFFGWGMAMLHPIAIDRGDGRQAMKQVLQQGVSRLKDGIWVVIFPEGTRMKTGEAGKIKAGGAMLAAKAKVPVYLVAHNAGAFWPKNSFMKVPGVIDVYISEPIDVSDLTVAQINELTEEWFLKHTQTKQEDETALKT